MIFGQLNRDHEKNSVPMDPTFINRNPQIFAKYEVVANVNCMDEVEEEYFTSTVHRVFRMNARTRKVMRPSLRVFMKDSQLICHPTLATNIERTLREYTAKALNTVE
ncbi:hypothetical protein pEaSNUABM35_00199 [Erwinia phage pEa_SNUABM_35]|uniref:Uncharacterized protein n=1 Tax=Erwinia phage pEa_SNUABM_35 TaxID=2869557 RepID=A0AAE8C3N2_9CAUD|nr:hypothetical protein MPK65_gp199 [Erwinia phage pEa_SNUABM_35]QZE60116.1 hypothetical protein pEaSNUABM35_00199 [Erwinia phage pEa_SNUABM_35]QZE60452.1 hypothetical protein pEaSNUABM36_00199 [Erwinia phage pEa_SNUABM_36]